MDATMCKVPATPPGIWAVGARWYSRPVDAKTDRVSIAFFVCEIAQRKKFDTEFNSKGSELGRRFGFSGGVGPAAKVEPSHVAWGVWSPKLINTTLDEAEFVVLVMKHGLDALAAQFPQASIGVEDWLQHSGVSHPANLKPVTMGLFSAGAQVNVAAGTTHSVATGLFDSFVSPTRHLLVAECDDPSKGSAREFHPNDHGIDMNWWRGAKSPIGFSPYLFYDFEVTG
jgi:hypothetical protein